MNSVNIVSHDSLMAQRRRETRDVRLPFEFNGKECFVETKMVNGEMEQIELDKPIGEMLTTAENLYDLVEKTVVDLQLGREAVPLVYKPIYRTVENRKLTSSVKIKNFVGAQCVFVAKLEGEEVQFGTRLVQGPDTIPIVTYAAGFEWSEDMVEYDETWEASEASRSMGEAYNAKLNHMHLYPIISYASYGTAGSTNAVTSYSTRWENIRQSIQNGLEDAYSYRNTVTGHRRMPTIMLCGGKNRWDVEQAIGQFQSKATVYPALGNIDTLIFYDGWAITMDGITTTYDGVGSTECFLIEPKRYFVELIKHDLLISAQAGDLHRLVERTVVGRARRGVVTSISESVQRVILPTS